jgi:putative MATE family efflux protein
MKIKTRSHKVDMLNGPLAWKIFMFALPLALSSILQQLFNSADLAVVGRFASSQAMAAVGANGSPINLIVSLFTGLSLGANVAIGTFIGQNDERKTNEAVESAFTISLICGLILVPVGLAVSRPLLVLMDTPEDVLELAVLYLRIYFLAVPFIMVYNFGSAILRAKGDSNRPLLCLVVSGVVNVILNLFFVIICGMSVDGVAIATVISNIISAGMVTYFLIKESGALHLSLRCLKIKKEYLVKMARIGLPAGLQGMVFSLSNVVIQSAINSFGSDAIAGTTAGQNFEFMDYFIVNAFAQAAVTFTSQNYGAGKYDRCKRVFLITMVMGESLTLALSMFFWLGRGLFIQMFTTDATVISYAMIRMLYVSNLEIGTGTYEISGGCLRGMGVSMPPTILTIFGSCVFRLIYVATIFERFHSYTALVLVYPISWAITGTAVITLYFIMRKKLM